MTRMKRTREALAVRDALRKMVRWGPVERAAAAHVGYVTTQDRHGPWGRWRPWQVDANGNVQS